MNNGTLAHILASIEIASIELEYASADLAAQCGLDRWRADAGNLEFMLAKLRLVRTALATAQGTLGEAAASASGLTPVMAAS